MNRYRFIAAEKAHHSVVLLCAVLGVAKSAFYAWQRQNLSARAQADGQLTDEIKDIYDDSRCTYGAPRVHAELRKRGKRVGRKRVARLMRTAGLVGRCPRRFRRTTIPDPSTHVQDLVQRQFDPTEPNQLWLSDITYIRTWEGWLYLAVILDAFSRKVVGWALADHLRTELATAALQLALPVDDRRQGSSTTPIAAANTPAPRTATCSTSTLSARVLAGPGRAGTTRSLNHSLQP